MIPTADEDARLLRRFRFTEILANLVGAPLATLFGGSMIDFSRIAPERLAIVVLVAMAANQLLLALPANALLSREIRRGLESRGRDPAFPSLLARLPALQAGLVLARMAISGGAVIAFLREGFVGWPNLAAAFVFALYASFLTGLVLYYALRSESSRTLERLVENAPPDAPWVRALASRRSEDRLANLPLVIPTFLASLAVLFLAIGLSEDTTNARFYLTRIFWALAFNLVASAPAAWYGRRHARRRLDEVRAALDDITTRGDTTGRLATDLSDSYARLAGDINRAFDLFRLVLARLDAAADGVAETVMSFSAQIGETVAATTQQAAAVREIVTTMEGSNRISRRIKEDSDRLAEVSRDSKTGVDEGFGKVRDTTRKMDEIRDANGRTLSEIGEVAEDVASIGEIVDIIGNIANQTRIIAFNAELEASAAGAAGTSFRIVAEEIRRLADGTVEALSGIRTRVDGMRDGASRLLASSEEGTAKIEEGMRLASDLDGIFDRIRGHAEESSVAAEGINSMIAEQNRGFDQVFLTLKQVAEGADQVLASARASGEGVARLKELTEELGATVGRFDIANRDDREAAR